MKRSVPTVDADIISLYMRTYYSLLRTTEEVQIRTLEETHTTMHSILHERAGALVADMSAFIYSGLRLPDCIRRTRLIVLGQTEEVFRRRGFDDFDNWTPVSAPGRRRRLLFDGKETLVAFIASLSDVDDIIPILVAFQIEWNKIHQLIMQAGLQQRVIEWAETEQTDSALPEDLQKAFGIDAEEWGRLERVWGANLPALLCDVAAQRKRMAVQLLAGSYVDYRRATQRWWWHVIHSSPHDLHDQDVYFVSSNTHSLTNMLTGFAQRHESTLIDYIANSGDRELQMEAQRIRQGSVPSNWANFLYYVLKKYLATPQGLGLAQERAEYETNHGITRIPSSQTFDLEAQVIDLARLDPDSVDRRLHDLPLERLAHSKSIILNIDYPLGFAAYHLLSRVVASAGDLRGLYVIGKAATLNGRIGDVLIPNVVYDEHSRNTYLFNNVFKATDVARYVAYGDVLDNQRAITVRGTFLQTEGYMKGFLDAGYTDAEMEAGPYLSAVYEFMRPRRYPMDEVVNLYRTPFEIGILHYASDTPISKGQNLGAQNLSYYGMDPTYAATVAVLRRIFMLETTS